MREVVWNLRQRNDEATISKRRMREDPMDAQIDAAVTRLKAGELVVIPTETVYGLAADAKRPEAVQKIFALKRRPQSRPLIVHLEGASQLDAWAKDIPAYARALAERFWPGPLTLVLKKQKGVPDIVTGGQDTVALRVPAHPLTLRLLCRFGGGLAAPSANRYGRISPTRPEHVRRQFGEMTPLLLDGGPCTVGIESTIVACLDEKPRVLRAGSISPAAMAEVTGRPVRLSGATEAVRAPGQDASHYAPTTKTYLVDRASLASFRAAHPGRAGFLGFAPPGFEVAVDLRLPDDPQGAARELYAALHALDEAGLDLIVVEAPPDAPEWLAVRDRLSRAAARAA